MAKTSILNFQVAPSKNLKEAQTETKQEKASEPKQVETPEIKATRKDIFKRRRPSLLMKPIPTEAKELKNTPIFTKNIIKSAQTKESTESSKDERSNNFLNQLFRKRSRAVSN